MTPLGINIAIHYYSRVTDYGGADLNYDAPSVQALLDQFVSLGLLELHTDRPVNLNDVGGQGRRRYEPTDGLKLYVERLCEVRLPTRRWSFE